MEAVVIQVPLVMAAQRGDADAREALARDCAACRTIYEELEQLREVTMTTQLDEPRDLQWDEHLRGPFSSLSRGFGWLILMVWVAGTAGFGLWQLATRPEDLAGKLIVFGGLFGVGLLFTSILIDRLRTAKTDRYREVQK